jgi:branched-chain amino acid transport system substrate-binding protein
MANTSALPRLALSLLLLGCGLPAQVQAQAQAQPELRIGAVVSITGGASALGVNSANAIKLLEEQFAADKSLPYKVKIVTYDDATDPTKAVNAVRRLIQEDAVHAVICCTTTPNSMAVIPVVQQAQVPNISMALAASVIEPVAQRRFVFKTATTDGMTVARVVDDMIKRKIKRVAFLGLEDSFGEGGWIEFQKITKARGLEIVAAERFARNDSNFTSQALRVRQANPEAVYFHAIPPSSALAQEALHRAGFRGQVYQSGGSANQGFLNVGKATVEGTIVAVGPIQIYKQLPANHAMAPALNEFAKVFDERYGQGKADIFAGYGWDAVRMTVAAYDGLHRKKAVPADLPAARLALRDAIESLREYHAVSGVFNFSPDNHLGMDHRSMYLTTVKGGQFQLNAD